MPTTGAFARPSCFRSNQSTACTRRRLHASCALGRGDGSRARLSPKPPPRYDSLQSPLHAAFAILPFQLEPALAVVRGLASRVLIADEVGLGKTVQAGLVISEILMRRPDARVLVVAPAGLREQWQAELGERFGLGSTLLDSPAIARQAVQHDNPWSIHGVVITSLDYVKRPEVVRALEGLIWDVLVFDEAHALAGRSDRATVASILAHRARTLHPSDGHTTFRRRRGLCQARVNRRLRSLAPSHLSPPRLPSHAARRRPDLVSPDDIASRATDRRRIGDAFGAHGLRAAGLDARE